MFPRHARLARGDFEAATRRAIRRSSPHFTVLVSTQAQGYAVVVSKKVARLAVDRHRLKRRIVGVLRTISLPPSLVVHPRKEALLLSVAQMRVELGHLLSQYGRDNVQ